MPLFLVLALAYLLAAPAAPPTADGDPLAEIRARYAQITAAKAAGSLRAETLTYDCPDHPSQGSITFYYAGHALRLIDWEFSEGDHYGQGMELYVWDDSLFFAYHTTGYWTFAGSTATGEPVVEDRFEEFRFYFHHHQPIRCLEKRFSVRSTDPNPKRSDQVPNQEGSCEQAGGMLTHFFELQGFAQRPELEGTCIWE